MRDIFEEIFKGEPIDPVEATRRSGRVAPRQRFYERAHVADAAPDEGFAVLLDQRPVRTPARRQLAAPTEALADAIAAEWNGQGPFIEPARMPHTRLANSIIDGVADKPGAVGDEVANYLATDLVFYRAGTPEGLVRREAQAWDPIVAWARDALGARFILAEGMVHVAQPAPALAAAGSAIPQDYTDPKELWRLGALHVITTLTGSALIALAVLHRQLSAEQAWAAAHVDEDWNMEQWGRDDVALERRAVRFTEMQAAATVLALCRQA